MEAGRSAGAGRELEQWTCQQITSYLIQEDAVIAAAVDATVMLGR